MSYLERAANYTINILSKFPLSLLYHILFLDYDSGDSSHHDKTPSSVDQDANEDSKFDSGRETTHGSKPYGRKRHKKKHSKGGKKMAFRC